MARTVFIAEDEDLDRALADDVRLTGRFSASLEDEDRERACEAATARLELPPGWRATPVAEPLEDHELGRAS